MLTIQSHLKAQLIEQIMAVAGRSCREPRRFRSGLERLALEHVQRIHRRLIEEMDRTYAGSEKA